MLGRSFFIYRAVYVEKNGECAGHIVYRTAFVDRTGIINPDIVNETLGKKAERPSIPNWIAKWIEAENNRPWPPDKE